MKTVPLREVVEVTMGQAPPGASYNSSGQGLPLIAGAGDFDQGQLKVSKFTTSPGKIAVQGDIVLSIRASIGDRVWADAEYCLGRGVAGLRAGDLIHRGYLWHWLESATPALRDRGRGATFLQVNRNDIREMLIPLPPKEEQRRIAAILDQADAIRTQRRQALTHLDGLPQALYGQMFGSMVRDISLGDVVMGIESGVSPVCVARPAREGEVGVLKLGAVTYGRFNPTENKAFLGDVSALRSKFVSTGDVLMTRKNTPQLVGAVAYVNEARDGLVFPDLIFRLTLDSGRICPRFFQVMMMSPRVRDAVRSLAGGAAASMSNISQARLRALLVPCPPVNEQREFEKRLLLVGNQRERVERQLAADEELFASLQARAFRGEL